MKSKPAIAVFDTKPYDQEFFEAANARFGFALRFFRPRLNADTVRMAEGFPAVCVFVNDAVDAPTADALARMGVRFVALRCAGYNNVDLRAAAGRLRVVRVPAYSPHAVAEHAVALMLALNRKTHRAYLRTRDANFSLQGLLGFDLHGKTAGVIGTGKIGRVVVGILRGFGMQVLAHDPFPDSAFAAASGCRYAPLEEIFRASDVITLHCPLTPETAQMIRAETIAQMKKGVTIINTGRGKLIRTKDLIAGLKSGRIGAAGLDVYEEEEHYFFEDYSAGGIQDDVLARLTTFPNVLITAHQAFFTREALANIAATTLENLRCCFAGEPSPNEICVQCAVAGPPELPPAPPS